MITLRQISYADTDNIVKWRNSWEVRKNLCSQMELTPEQHHNWLKSYVKTGLCYQFIIEVSCNDGFKRDIGTVFIKDIDITDQKGQFGIFIGEAEGRGKGYATIATRKILEFAFTEITLNRVYLTVFADNVAAIKSYELAGFTQEGILKQDFLRYDGFVDVICMGITKDIWINNKGM